MSIETGKLGENIAKEFLINKEYEILAQNWRFSRAEIDIVAKHKDLLVFVEVKTRSSESHGKPEEFLSKYQENMITDAASQYMASINYQWEFRFDLISILLTGSQVREIKHFEDAFFPGL